MKKIFILIISIAVFSACEDDLDQAPISERSAANFYRNTEDFEQAVNGVYHSLNDYSSIHFYLSEVRSDNVYSPGTGVREWNPVNNFDKTLETNVLMETAWNEPFRGIYLANTVLDQITEDLVPEQDARTRMIGECKFLRALFYFDLVRLFGKVPVLDHVTTPAKALEIPRTPVTDAYELIVDDLEEAISLLPEAYSAPGKATSLAAKALLAKVYLTMSGPTYGIEGPGIAADEYSKALTLLNEVIGSGKFSWVNDYAQIFGYDTEANGDIIFAVQNINDGTSGDRGIGTILPTLMYHESFAKVYLPFAGGVPGDSPINPSDQLLASFDDQDVRDDVSILMSYVDENGNTNINPQFVKFLSLEDPHVPVDRFNWGINFPVIRYTDVLLMKAEALLQTGGGQTEIDQIVNDVRTRAGIGTVSNVTMDMLLEERRKEFVAEGLRWHDLVRTGKVIEVMNAWEAIDDAADKIPGIVANDIIYAIHQSQLEVKEGLYEQNPGY
jgi:hypothetical protein